jgi:antitoxin component of MazEF toxin-antitoxin module
MMKKLVKHGNSKAIIVDKALLEAAGLSENTLFQVTLNPSGGLVIQSIDDNKTAVFQEKFDELNEKYRNLMQRLADL